MKFPAWLPAELMHTLYYFMTCQGHDFAWHSFLIKLSQPFLGICSWWNQARPKRQRNSTRLSLGKNKMNVLFQIILRHFGDLILRIEPLDVCWRWSPNWLPRGKHDVHWFSSVCLIQRSRPPWRSRAGRLSTNSSLDDETGFLMGLGWIGPLLQSILVMLPVYPWLKASLRSSQQRSKRCTNFVSIFFALSVPCPLLVLWTPSTQYHA